MSAATNLYGSSSGSEGPSGDSIPAVNVTRIPLFRPSAFVCQRCLRLLDMFPLASEMNRVDLDSTFEGDLIKVLERIEPNKRTGALYASSDAHLRSQSMASVETRASMGSSTYVPPAGASIPTRASSGAKGASGNKKKGEAGISRTFTSFTNFFKGSNPAPTNPTPTNVSPTSTTNVVPSPPGASAPKGAAISVPTRSSPEDTTHQHVLIEDEDTPMPRDEYDPEDDSMLLAGASSAAASSAAMASSMSPSASNGTGESISPMRLSQPEDAQPEDATWEPSFSPPGLSTSVSRALIRERSIGPSLIPTARRTKRIQGYNTSTSDYVSKRHPTRDALSLAQSSASLSSSNSLSNSQVISKSSMRKASLLVAQATIETEIDFPLCVECSHDVLSELDDEEYDLDTQIDAYEQELAWCNHEYFSRENFSREIGSIQKRMVDCEHGLIDTTSKIISISDDMAQLKLKDRELLMSKSEYWRQFEIHAADREAMLENTISAHNRLTHAKRWLDLVRSSHVMNDAFCIGVDLHLGTIGGLRLGRMPSAPIEWTEISAAFGLVLHLLFELSIRSSFAFPKYKLILEGSFSGIQRNSGTTLPLHSDSDISLVRLVHFKGINDALTSLTEYIFELATHLKANHPNFMLPFIINKDLVAGVSVKRAWNSTGATWSTALRSLLANLKYILAFLAKLGLCT